MIIAPIVTMRKIHQGSKSCFAYILVSFCMMQGFQDTTCYIFSSLRIEYTSESGNQYFLMSYRSFVVNTACYQFLAVQTWIFAMKYLESSVKMSIQKPLCTERCINIVKWCGICLLICTTWGMMIYQQVTFPGLVNNDSSDEFEEYLNTQFALSSQIQTYPWLSMHVLSTIITGYAIYKITMTTRTLKTVEVNTRTMLLHISMLIIQNLVMMAVILFGAVSFVIDENGYELALFGRFDVPLTYVDALIELIICYICYTMGSSAALRRFDCNIQMAKNGGYEVKFRPKNMSNSVLLSDCDTISDFQSQHSSDEENPEDDSYTGTDDRQYRL